MLVIAGNKDQFEYAKTLGQIPRDSKYLSRIEDIRGRANDELILTGTYYQRRDWLKANELYRYCEQHNIRIKGI